MPVPASAASPEIQIQGGSHCVINGDHSHTHQTHQNSHNLHRTPVCQQYSHCHPCSGTRMMSGICLDLHLTCQQQQLAVTKTACNKVYRNIFLCEAEKTFISQMD